MIQFIVHNLYHSIYRNWSEPKVVGGTWLDPNPFVNKGQVTVIVREDYGVGSPTYGTEICLPGHSSGITAQYKYIGNSIERNYFNEIVLRLR